MNPTAQKIMDCAERMIREGGYHSFSFRQIAEELSIKSASIHYHFSTKEALGEAVTRRYTANFLEAMGDPSQQKSPLKHYVLGFQNSLKTHGHTCLCCVLTAECGRLPSPIRQALQDFTAKNLTWLESALKKLHPSWPAKKLKETAAMTFSALEGAITFSALSNDTSHLEQVGKALIANVS